MVAGVPMRASLGLGVLAVLAVGCGGDDSGKPAVSTNQDNVCDQVAAVACYDLYQCCSEGEIEKDLGVTDPRTEDQCREDVSRICARNFARFEASLAAKRVTFTASAMNACLTALLPADSECATVDSMVPWTAPCMESVWTGAVAEGGMCFYGFECAGSPDTSYCAPNQTCKALPTAGQPCSLQGCAAGNYCASTICAPLLGVGGLCASNTQCAKDLFCDLGGSGSCQPLRQGGEACTSNSGCASAQCLPGTCTGTNQSCYTSANCNGTCTTGPLLGSFCSVDTNCQSHCSVTTTQSCVTSTTCPATETCVPYTCTHPTCSGDIVCASRQLTVDYCTGPASVLGI